MKVTEGDKVRMRLSLQIEYEHTLSNILQEGEKSVEITEQDVLYVDYHAVGEILHELGENCYCDDRIKYIFEYFDEESQTWKKAVEDWNTMPT